MAISVSISQFSGGVNADPVEYPFDIWDGQAKTIAFKIGNGFEPFWQAAYTYSPEWLSSLQNELYVWKNGLLYRMNNNDAPCNFFGVQHKPKVMCVSNMNPSEVKVYNNISLESGKVPTLAYFLADTPYLQTTDIKDYEWRNFEGMIYANIKRNKLTPTYSGYSTSGLLTGQKVRTVALFMMFEFTASNTPLELRFINLIFEDSRGQATT